MAILPVLLEGGNYWSTSACPGLTTSDHFEVAVSEGGESGGHELLLGGTNSCINVWQRTLDSVWHMVSVETAGWVNCPP